jgi:hypothetical protein
MTDADENSNVTINVPAAFASVGAFSPRVGVRQYFAAEHLWAARLMAHLCREREDQLVREGAHGLVDYHVRSYALTAIAESVALLEAQVNEVWQGAADTEPGADNHRLRGLSAAAIAMLRELRQNPKVERSLSVLDKYAVALTCASKTPLDRSHFPYQDVNALIGLRNAFVHFKPEMHWTDEVHDLEARIKHLVPENPLMRGTVPWFPHQPLCAGVARWAWESCMTFADQWHAQLGLEVSYRQDMVPWPDGLP